MSSSINTIPNCPALQYLKTADGNIAYREQGQGQCILFLHGLLGSSKAWAFQFEALSKNYRVIAWDAPGYGGSDAVDINIDAYVKALNRLLDHLEENAIVLVGHSMGGSVAAKFAATYPEKVKKLVLSCTHPGYAEAETAPISAKLEKRMQELEALGKEAYGMNRARDLLPFEDTPISVLNYAAQVASETNPDGLRKASRMLQLADNRAFLPTLSMPILILTGELDTVVLPWLTQDLLRLTPYQQHIVMPGVAHAPYFQKPPYYNDILNTFITSN